MVQPIIVIAGTYGVGKTTLAHNLAIKLNIRQRFGVGIIHKTLLYRNLHDPVINSWGDYGKCVSPADVIKKLRAESRVVGKVVSHVIEKATQTGEPYLIDGVQLLPQYLPMRHIKYLVLDMDDKDKHEVRFLEPKITKRRHYNNATFRIAGIIQREIIASAKKYNIPIFESSISELALAKKVIKILNLKKIR